MLVGANTGSRATKKLRNERSNEMGLSASGFCSESNPRPGSKISTPVFGCELFVAPAKDITTSRGDNPKLFTAIHNFVGPPRLPAHGQPAPFCGNRGTCLKDRARRFQRALLFPILTPAQFFSVCFCSLFWPRNRMPSKPSTKPLLPLVPLTETSGTMRTLRSPMICMICMTV